MFIIAVLTCRPPNLDSKPQHVSSSNQVQITKETLKNYETISDL